MEKPRLLEMDLMRVLALALVIFQHCWSGIGLDAPARAFSCHGYSALIYGVPLFVMISGFFQLSAATLPVGAFLKKRFTRLLLPFFLWMTVVYILSVLMHKYDDVQTVGDAFRLYVPYFVGNRVNDAFWYVYMLSGLYLITPVLQRALAAPDRKRLLEYCQILWVLLVVLGDFLPQFTFFQLFPVAGRFVGYYLAGYYIGTYLKDKACIRWIGAAGLAVSFALNVALKYAGHSFFILEMGEVVSLFLLVGSFRPADSPASRLLTRISRYSYTIYLTHFVLIRLFYTALPGLFPQHWATPLYAVALVLACETVFCFILERLHIPGKWTGIAGRA